MVDVSWRRSTAEDQASSSWSWLWIRVGPARTRTRAGSTAHATRRATHTRRTHDHWTGTTRQHPAGEQRQVRCGLDDGRRWVGIHHRETGSELLKLADRHVSRACEQLTKPMIREAVSSDQLDDARLAAIQPGVVGSVTSKARLHPSILAAAEHLTRLSARHHTL